MSDAPDMLPPFRRRDFLLVAVAFAAAVVPRAAHANRWIPLARAAIDPAADKTELVVEPTSARLRSFRLRARGGSIEYRYIASAHASSRGGRMRNPLACSSWVSWRIASAAGPTWRMVPAWVR